MKSTKNKLEASRKYAINNKEKISKYYKKYYFKNKEKIVGEVKKYLKKKNKDKSFVKKQKLRLKIIGEKSVKELSTIYIKQILVQRRKEQGLKYSIISQDIVEVKRIHLQVYRLLQQLRKGVRVMKNKVEIVTSKAVIDAKDMQELFEDLCVLYRQANDGTISLKKATVLQIIAGRKIATKVTQAVFCTTPELPKLIKEE